MLSEINTIEFLKWDQDQNKSVLNWKDVFDIEWICFGCNVSTFKHAPFCHYLKSYLKRESDRFSINRLHVNAEAFLSCKDLVLLCHDEEKFCKKVGVSCNTYREQLSRHDSEYLGTKELLSSLLTNHVAQDLLVLKDKSVEGFDEEENNNAMETSFKLPNNEVESDNDNKPAAVEIELSETQIQEMTTTAVLIAEMTATATAMAATVTTTGKHRSPNATKSKVVAKNNTRAKIRVPKASKTKLSNLSNEPVIAKRMTERAQAKGSRTKGAQIKATQAKGGTTKGAQIKGGQRATTRSLTRIDVNPLNVTVVDVGILDNKKKATTSKNVTKKTMVQ